MSSETRTALVTGASRGIGRATAIALAEAGFDVAITARTVVDGDPSSLTEDGKVLPGSLASTAAEIEALGQRAVQVPLDLLDREALVPAVESAISGLGHLDVVVNNAIYVTGGGPKHFLDTDPDDLVNQMWGDLTAQLLLLQPQVAHMVTRGGGVVINTMLNKSAAIAFLSVLNTHFDCVKTWDGMKGNAVFLCKMGGIA